MKYSRSSANTTAACSNLCIGRYDLVHVKELASSKHIARLAEFLLDSSGTVRWRMVTENFFVIAKPEQVLERQRRYRRMLTTEETLEVGV